MSSVEDENEDIFYEKTSPAGHCRRNDSKKNFPDPFLTFHFLFLLLIHTFELIQQSEKDFYQKTSRLKFSCRGKFWKISREYN